MQTNRGGYRGKPKPKLPQHLKRVRVNARIQKGMQDQLKAKGEPGYILKKILKRAEFPYVSGQMSPQIKIKSWA